MHIEYLDTRYCYDVPHIYSIANKYDLNIFEVYAYDPVAYTLSGKLKRAALFTCYWLPVVMIEQVIKYRIDGHPIFVYKCISVTDITSKFEYFYLCDYSFETGAIRKLTSSFKYEHQLNCDTSEEHTRIVKWSFCNKAFGLEFPYVI